MVEERMVDFFAINTYCMRKIIGVRAFRRCVLVLLLCWMADATVCSQTTMPGTKRVRLQRNSVSLKEIIKEIQQQTGVSFFYADRILPAEKMNVDFKELPLQEVLDKLLSPKKLQWRYQPESQRVEITADGGRNKMNEEGAGAGSNGRTGEPAAMGLAGLLPQANMLTTVSGKVSNIKGEPLQGAYVKEKGSIKGVATNEYGDFKLTNVPDSGTLVFSFAGYEEMEVPVNGRSMINTTLKAGIARLGDVVVSVNTGYQQISKERFVGSVSALDSAAYHRRAGMTIIDRLDGTVTGVSFNRKGPAALQVRGISTLGNNQTSLDPLIVVDNFPYKGNINTINPNDVESITVLKDAAAASIWGTMAGNGVIVITTKKGKVNQPLRISYTSNVTIQEKPDVFFLPRMTTAEEIGVETFLFGRGYYNASLNNVTSRPALSPVVEMLAKRRAGLITAADSADFIRAVSGLDYRNDLDKYVYRSSVQQQHYINLSGGSSMASYTLSAGFNKSTPNISGARGEQQYTLSSQTVIRPVAGAELEAGVHFSKSDNRLANFSLPNLYPYARLADDDGNALPVPNLVRKSYTDTAGGGRLLDWNYRPLDEIRLSDNRLNTRLLRLSFRGAYRLTSWLKAELLYQYTEQQLARRNHYSQETFFTRNLINRFTQITGNTVTRNIPPGGIVDISNISQRTNNWRGQFSASKSWNQKHQLAVLVAGEINETVLGSNENRFYGFNSQLSTYASGLNYNVLYPTYGNLSGSNRIPQQATLNDNGEVSRIVSVLANASYTYLNRYTLYGSLRRDGANVFGVNTNNKWKPLWSAGFGWNLSDASFYHVNWMPQVKLKASFGYMGNVNNRLSGAPTILYMTSPDFITNNIYAQVGDAPNPDLRWEQVTTANIGVDLGLFQSRLTASIDVFRKRSTDVISPIPIDPTAGLDLYTVNSASLTGKGFEININSINITGAFGWTSRLGLSYVKTLVTEVYNGGLKTNDFLNYTINPVKGRVAFGVSSFRWAGLDPTNGDPQGYLNKNVSKDYLSILNDSVQNQVFHGSGIPLYTGYLGNSFSFKGFVLSCNITYRLGYYYRRPALSYGALYTTWNGHADYASRWQKPGDEAFTNVPSMPYPLNANRDNFYQYSEINVGRGDNVRLQDIHLQYDFDKRMFPRLPFERLQLFVYANNLNMIIWRADKQAYDPDFAGGTGNVTTGPTPRSWTAGVNISF